MPTATSRAASTTRRRRGSRPSPATRSSRSTPSRPTSSSARAASSVKEERAELTKHHIDVMWHDYFKPEHVEKFPDLHDVCWKASKQASQVKRTVDLAEAQKLLDLIDKIDMMWRETGGPGTTRLQPAAYGSTPAHSKAMRRLAVLAGTALFCCRWPPRHWTRSTRGRGPHAWPLSGHSMEPTLPTATGCSSTHGAYSTDASAHRRSRRVPDPRLPSRCSSNASHTSTPRDTSLWPAITRRTATCRATSSLTRFSCPRRPCSAGRGSATGRSSEFGLVS